MFITRISELNVYHKFPNMQEKGGMFHFSTFIFESTVLFFSKLKRDSVPYDSDISETDKLLLQKDEEVRIYTGTHLLWILIYVIF